VVIGHLLSSISNRCAVIVVNIKRSGELPQRDVCAERLRAHDVRRAVWQRKLIGIVARPTNSPDGKCADKPPPAWR
jgi:hypothetical protein